MISCDSIVHLCTKKTKIPTLNPEQIGQPLIEATISLDDDSSGFQLDCTRSLKLQHQPRIFFYLELWLDAFPMATHSNQSRMSTSSAKIHDVTSCSRQKKVSQERHFFIVSFSNKMCHNHQPSWGSFLFLIVVFGRREKKKRKEISGQSHLRNFMS